jgi:exopolyphosphatase/guanosine-5'-triphosphate,3'-diphosphate pyrophosphatase
MGEKNRDETAPSEAQKHPIAIRGRQCHVTRISSVHQGMIPTANTLSDETEILFVRHETEPEHPRQVARLALALFDGLSPLHRYGANERRLLECAALLHDIGWSVSGPDGRGHHKASALLIREFPWKTLTPKEVRSVAAVARYHRKALPKSDHEDLRGLSRADRSRVDWLAACLRTADGLDRRHLQLVNKISIRFLERQTELWVDAPGQIDEEMETADLKSDLIRGILPGSLKLIHRRSSGGGSEE